MAAIVYINKRHAAGNSEKVVGAIQTFRHGKKTTETKITENLKHATR